MEIPRGWNAAGELRSDETDALTRRPFRAARAHKSSAQSLHENRLRLTGKRLKGNTRTRTDCWPRRDEAIRLVAVGEPVRGVSDWSGIPLRLGSLTRRATPKASDPAEEGRWPASTD